MITGKRREIVRVNKGAILGMISSEDIYRYYWRDFEIDKMYSSPFREDSTPSFHIHRDRDEILRHRDFGDLKYQGDCFDFVAQQYGILHRDVLVMIDKDLNLGLWSGKDLSKPMIPLNPEQGGGVTVKQRTLIQVEPRKFSPEEYTYWGQYRLDKEDLKKGKVFSVGRLWVNRKLVPNYSEEMRFAYLFEERDEQYLKVYTPLADKKNRFITNAPGDLLAGRSDLPFLSDTVIVTKARKDNLVLLKVHSEVVSVQSESTGSISLPDIEFLKGKYKRVILNFDPDQTGVEACRYYNQFGFGYFNTPRDLWELGIKDMADLAKERGLEEVRNLLIEKNIITL